MVDNEHKYITVHKNGKTIIKDETIKEEKLQHKKETNQKIKSRIYSYSSNTSSLFGSIIIILVAVAMIRILYNGSADTVSLRSFLDMLSTLPPVSNSVKTFVQGIDIVGPWLVLDELRVVLNSLIDVFAILTWMASSLVDVIFFIGAFLIWLFI